MPRLLDAAAARRFHQLPPLSFSFRFSGQLRHLPRHYFLAVAMILRWPADATFHFFIIFDFSSARFASAIFFIADAATLRDAAMPPADYGAAARRRLCRYFFAP